MSNILSSANTIDMKIIKNTNKPTSVRCSKLANYIGRKFVIGSVVGALRASYGVVKAALFSVGFIFSLVAAAITGICHKKTSAKLVNAAEFCRKESRCGRSHFGRGIVEILPIIGGAALTIYDTAQYKKQHAVNKLNQVGNDMDKLL